MGGGVTAEDGVDAGAEEGAVRGRRGAGEGVVDEQGRERFVGTWGGEEGESMGEPVGQG